ncbi:foldase protein PrsA precursor [mine drainage metagenome]|uniref:Foldase protein PrsA n=1 Tax=mine drainage metagenome TaxID=410659 RepID=A0A1J5TB07_9ZZZZ
MWNKKTLRTCLFWATTLICSPLYAVAADQVLATIGHEEIRSHDLDLAIASSPFNTQFNTMDEDEQASLRGDMLRRLVSARLLALEAKRLGMDKTAAFKHEIEDVRMGMLYRAYMDRLRLGVTIPADTLAAMKRQFKGDTNGLDSAKASYVAIQFKEEKQAALQKIQQDNNVRFFESRIQPGIKPDVVLMEGDGIRLAYGDVVDTGQWKQTPNPEWIKEQLHNRSELLLVSRAAEREGIDVSEQHGRFVDERLPALLLEHKAGEWVPNEESMRAWYVQHRDAGRIPASYHVGQLVVGSKDEAESLRVRIVKGESLFTLAGLYSIDPVGRKQNGDMGWITEGRGMPELLKELATLKDDELSAVIPTRSGYHLIMVLERRIGSQKPYEDVRDRVRQMMISQNLPAYLGELEKRYPVSWNVMVAQPALQPAATP